MELSTAAVVVVAAVVTAAGAWAFMFLPERSGIWPRTWVAAGALTTVGIVSLVVLGRLGPVVGPVDLVEIAIGLVAGGAWLVATHLGYAVLCRLFPAFGEQVLDLYRLGANDTPGRMVGPIVAMGIAEELLFRGVLQSTAGVVIALAAYTLVQVFEGKWALVLAALLGGIVWGALFAWRGGLVAPVVAHVLWTGTLTFVWTLGGCGPDARAAVALGTATRDTAGTVGAVSPDRGGPAARA